MDEQENSFISTLFFRKYDIIKKYLDPHDSTYNCTKITSNKKRH